MAVPCKALTPAEADRVFFTAKGRREAKRLCAGCPAREVCLGRALDAEAGDDSRIRYGVYGGVTGPERAKIDQPSNHNSRRTP